MIITAESMLLKCPVLRITTTLFFLSQLFSLLILCIPIFFSVLDARRVQTLFDKMSLASSEKGLNKTNDTAKQLRRSLLARHLLDQHESVARLLTLMLCAEASMSSRLLNPDENITQNVLSILAVEYKGIDK